MIYEKFKKLKIIVRLIVVNVLRQYKMTSIQQRQQVDWSGEVSVLQHFIYSILSHVVTNKEHIAILFGNDAMINYWIPCFTHLSADANKNYETFEFYGDKSLGNTFVMYLRDSFGDQINQSNGTLLLNTYMEKTYQAELSREYNLDLYVKFDPHIKDASIHVQEDIFEAFFGCFVILVDDKIQKGLGYTYGYNLLAYIFNKINISLENVRRDYKSQLKELFEKLIWGAPAYKPTLSDNTTLGEWKVAVRGPNGTVLGIGYGSQKRAAFDAAKSALDYLVTQGYTEEHAEKVKLERAKRQNPEFDKQWNRFEQAIIKINETARNMVPPRPEIIDKTLSTVGKPTKERDGLKYTIAIKVLNRGMNEWQILKQDTGPNLDKLKINLLKSVADSVGIQP